MEVKMNSGMKILVVDDSPIHREAARQTLGAGHDLTVVGKHDDAVRCLSVNTERYWDAVLSDLLMPAGKRVQGGLGLEFVGTDMPIGWARAVDAALNGAQYVAVVTDMNHHAHPASALLDSMNSKLFKINQATALFTNYCPKVNIGSSQEDGKDWGKILSYLIGDEYL
jgi:CheY-like chemotaxis protein